MKARKALILTSSALPHQTQNTAHTWSLSSTKEEREAGVRKPIVGNLKEFGSQAQETEEYTYQPQTGAQQTRPAQQAPQNVEQDGDLDLPF